MQGGPTAAQPKYKLHNKINKSTMCGPHGAH
jgi:hypothetical protein